MTIERTQVAGKVVLEEYPGAAYLGARNSAGLGTKAEFLRVNMQISGCLLETKSFHEPLRPASCGPGRSVGLNYEVRSNCARPNRTLVKQCTGREHPDGCGSGIATARRTRARTLKAAGAIRVFGPGYATNSRLTKACSSTSGLGEYSDAMTQVGQQSAHLGAVDSGWET